MLRDSSRITAPPAKRFWETTLAPTAQLQAKRTPKLSPVARQSTGICGRIAGRVFLFFN